MQDLEVGLKRPANINFTMMYKVLMVMGEVDLGLIPSPILTIVQVCLLDHWVL